MDRQAVFDDHQTHTNVAKFISNCKLLPELEFIELRNDQNSKNSLIL